MDNKTNKILNNLDNSGEITKIKHVMAFRRCR